MKNLITLFDHHIWKVVRAQHRFGEAERHHVGCEMNYTAYSVLCQTSENVLISASTCSVCVSGSTSS